MNRNASGYTKRILLEWSFNTKFMKRVWVISEYFASLVRFCLSHGPSDDKKMHKIYYDGFP